MKKRRPKLRPSPLLQRLCPMPTMLDSDEINAVFAPMITAFEAMTTGKGEVIHLTRVYGSAVMCQQLEAMGISSPDYPEFTTVIEAAVIITTLKWNKLELTLDESEIPLIRSLMTIEKSMLQQCPRAIWIEALDTVAAQAAALPTTEEAA